MMGHAVPAPRVVWQRLNLYWVLYFIVLGAINLAVALLLSEALWIKFKVFGNLALTFGFVFAQMPLLSKYLEEPDGDTLK
jgi:intracellular septation protein